MTKFDPTKPVQTRDGREAEICWTDGYHEYPLGGWSIGENGYKTPTTWTADGVYDLAEYGESRHDLVNVPEKPVTIEAFAVVNGYGLFCGLRENLSDATEYSENISGTKIVRLTGTFTPGESME